MLRARPLRNINEQKNACDACGMQHNADFLYYAIFEDETDCLGNCAFKFGPGYAEVLDVKPKIGTYDDEAMFILGKGVLNFIDLIGFKKVVYKADDTKHAKLMEYYPKDGVMQVNLEGYFEEHCKGRK